MTGAASPSEPSSTGPASATGTPPAVHPALLHDVRVHVHRLPVALPAAADRALPDPRPGRDDRRGRALPRHAHLRLGPVGPGHRRPRRPDREASHAPDHEPGDRLLLRRLRPQPQLLAAARPRLLPRPLLVGAPLRLLGLHDRGDPGEPAGRGDRLLGHVHHARDRGGAGGGPVDVPARLGLALRRDRRPQPGDGRDRLAPAPRLHGRGPDEPRPPPRRLARRVAGGGGDHGPLPVLVRVRGHHELRGGDVATSTGSSRAASSSPPSPSPCS